VPSINSPHFQFGTPKIGNPPFGYGSTEIVNPPLGFGSPKIGSPLLPFGESNHPPDRHPYGLHPNSPNDNNPSLGYGSYPNTPNINHPPLDNGIFEHPSVEGIFKEEGYIPSDPFETYEHPLTDIIPKEHDKTPVIHESAKDLYTGPPVIDPIHPDPGFVHPATHHIVHNGKIVYTHRVHRLEGPKYNPMHVARPVGSQGLGYGLNAFEPDGTVGGGAGKNTF